MASMDFTRFLKVCNRRRKGESFRTAVLFLFVAVQLCGGIYPDRPIRYNSFRLKQVSGSVSFHVRTHVQIHMCDCLRSSIKDIFQLRCSRRLCHVFMWYWGNGDAAVSHHGVAPFIRLRTVRHRWSLISLGPHRVTREQVQGGRAQHK